MKASQGPPPAPALPPFTPVVLVLESQAEVDALYALFNSPTICNHAALKDVLDDSWKTLYPFRSPSMNNLGDQFSAWARRTPAKHCPC